jgi:hypothetical protein
MRLELRPPLTPAGETEVKRDVGAVVARAVQGGVVLELGPSDGPPHLRLVLSTGEATRLIATIQGIANGGREEIFFVDE